MHMRFTVMGSGSSGNASLLECAGRGVLIDMGLGPRQLASRLTTVDASWQNIHWAFLTHVHGDHWKELTLAQLGKHGIILYCHDAHQDFLAQCSPAFRAMQAAKLVRSYEPHEDVVLTDQLRCRPLPLRHDGGLTCGFLFEGSVHGHGQAYRLAYAADLGSWEEELVQVLADVDLLALEFNHDVALEKNSGRPAHLIARVLGDFGHLSNTQAAKLVQKILDRSQPERLQHLVQLHLSRQCNRPALAKQAVRTIPNETMANVHVHTARQDVPGPCLQLGPPPNPSLIQAPRKKIPSNSRIKAEFQPWLPGWQE